MQPNVVLFFSEKKNNVKFVYIRKRLMTVNSPSIPKAKKKVSVQVRIQDLCKNGRGGPSEILPTSRSGVAVVAKIWASKLGVGVGGHARGSPRFAAAVVDDLL